MDLGAEPMRLTKLGKARALEPAARRPGMRDMQTRGRCNAVAQHSGSIAVSSDCIMLFASATRLRLPVTIQSLL